ncbi:MAG: bifunctional methylenetetrahydrofolate dehydrogenase/methenyltetrahydrofolate cyclohydrolase FolD [Candidatus Pacebacteria bacterium]|nr:bifunctional methylenetetrahydrofolate dehydrogenase/methenyltetrahydrofolate cyclohydrolase FolD [Candidatus Paceibacterota bacterium]MDR3583658.1 bifunctional methylenetetrahydrofolate dehydrogenase/methenyltetrahydrofolate cyclohydrolase FolD [Candidatus Paceibacterota bacterium]
MKILDGKKIAEEIKLELKAEILEMGKNGMTPGLAVVLVGSDPASRIYVANKKRNCEEVGIKSASYELAENISQSKLMELISRLNDDENIHGILVQLPLPKHIETQKIIEAIDPRKDVDCFHPENAGRLLIGQSARNASRGDADGPRFLPCTPGGILELLKRSNIEVAGKDCVIVGRSNIVGKPLAALLINAGATVTVCHSRTRNLKEKTLRAEILIVATGKAGLISADMVQPGSAVIDVGINRMADGKLVGDVDFENVKNVASAISPVPGGVGPMTIAMLLKNTITAARNLSS